MDKVAAIRIADEYFETGYIAYEKNEYIKAVQFADSAMELYSYFDEKYKICETLNLKGKILGGKGNETASLEKYLEGLEIAEENKFNDLLIVFYNNIGFRYEYIKQYDKALEYYKIANTYFKKIQKDISPKKDEYGIKLSFNFFDMYLQKRDMKKVDFYYSKIKYYLDRLDNEKIKQFFIGAITLREGMLAWINKDFITMKIKIEEIMILLKESFFDEYLWLEYPLLVDFLLESKHYEKCEKVIEHYIFEANKKDDVEAKISAIKLQMQLFKKQEKVKEYKEACVKYVELMENKDMLIKKEKGFALDFKISIRKIDAARKKAEKLLEIDSLTKIKNRYSFNKEIEGYFLDANKKKQHVILGILDIDSFHEVNLLLGHVGGDRVLVATAKIIKDALGEYGIVYRLGGDEFVVFCNAIDIPKAEIIANKIKEGLKEIQITISQGYISFIPKKVEIIDERIAKADKFLYQVKMNGKDNFKVIDIDCI